ncbi:MAG TPA: hypothetical protein VFL13_09905 [Candidatus Baltobacteraceae bacterium]|nr:hypothetical protein [Candidatus Baltobacteraceae bacterium]
MIVEALAGALAGFLASYVVPDSRGAAEDALFGLVGASVTAFVYKLANPGLSFDAFNAPSVAAAAAGAVLLVILLRMTAGRRTTG